MQLSPPITAKENVLERLVAELRRRLPAEQASAASDLLRRCYRNTPPEELQAMPIDEVLGPVIALWRLAQERQPGEIKIRVYDPEAQRDGWSSPHTAIDVVNDDMPFLLATTNAEMQRQGRRTHVVLHPLLGVERDASGHLQQVLPGRHGAAESWMHLEVDRETGGAAAFQALADRLRHVLAQVRIAVQDWRPMVAKAEEIAARLEQAPATLDRGEVDEAREFLRWLIDNHFTFLGYRGYALERRDGQDYLRLEKGSGLGLLREVSSESEERSDTPLPDYLARFLHQRELLIITKGTKRSEVHRPVHLDSIGVRRFDAQGNVVGEDRFLGLFTTAVYNANAINIPVLRRKVRRVIERAAFNPGSHDAKALGHVLEAFPRDELFQISEDDLFRMSLGILQLQQRQRVAVFLRKDEFERYVSVLVFVPRDRYTFELREAVQRILERALAGEAAASYAQVGDAALARLHYIVRTQPGMIPPVDTRQLEREIAVAARSWRDELGEELAQAHGEGAAQPLLHAYGEAFPAVYRDRFDTAEAIRDVAVVDRLLARGAEFDARLYRTADMPADRLRLKLYLVGRQIALTDALPMIEDTGVRVEEELPFQLRVRKGASGETAVWIHDFALVAAATPRVPFESAAPLVEEALRRVWQGDLESGVLNQLVLLFGIQWREVALLRAYSRYLRQIGMTYSQKYMAQTMVHHGELAQLLVRLFRTLFDPAHRDDFRSRAAQVLGEIRGRLEAVQSLDEDRILRGFLTVVKETLRTNFFQQASDAPAGEAGKPKSYISFKLDCKSIRQLPDPKPLYEIFVYSPRMEGVHLRGGMVARGGIRWSDRREDFRTEILGLVKAQMVKNAVIVPVGAKGGFVMKRPPTTGGREAFLAEGIECYKTLIRGLLDLTDNIVDGQVVHPPDVVRRDADDTYLVVAADKGTATFSDIANGVAEDYGFWLGDAFASGGSAGYDHKKMGITAKGAWEAVKRHFRELGRDIQTTPFTCVGVGDMSGDVFGNGMLLSPQTRLLAAFDHRHIFVDPNPDPAVSLRERQRLFDLPRSSWADYDPQAMSPGAALYERGAKTVVLSDEAAAALGTSKKKLTPNELVQVILTAPVDLLWLGGIGTFVKASRERHDDVGDRVNDALRVDARQLRCKVVGEGANLGFTQRARVEFALMGGRLNTDAIDNSAGVDTSDHEVNIKIALNPLMRAGQISREERDTFLASMTDEVAALVLRDNYLQTQAITLTESRAPELLDRHARMMRYLERIGRLDRRIEFLPDDEELRQRAAQRKGLVRPELAVLLAYAKISLYDDLLASDLPDDPLLAEDLLRYFPRPMVERFRAALDAHRLRREIIATYITNSTVNRVGPSFVLRMMETTGKSAPEVARAYTITRDAFDLRQVWAAVEELDNRVPAAVQVKLLQEVRQLTEHATLWFLQRYDQALDVSKVVGTFRPALRALSAELSTLVASARREETEARAAEWIAEGVPAPLARQVAAMRGLLAGTDVVRLALAVEAPPDAVARVYFGVGERFGLDWLRSVADRVKIESPWQRQALEGLVDDLSLHQVAITWQVLAGAGANKEATKGDWREAVAHWESRHAVEVGRLDKLLEELRPAEQIDLAMLSVADRQLQALSGR